MDAIDITKCIKDDDWKQRIGSAGDIRQSGLLYRMIRFAGLLLTKVLLPIPKDTAHDVFSTNDDGESTSTKPMIWATAAHALHRHFTPSSLSHVLVGKHFTPPNLITMEDTDRHLDPVFFSLHLIESQWCPPSRKCLLDSVFHHFLDWAVLRQSPTSFGLYPRRTRLFLH